MAEARVHFGVGRRGTFLERLVVRYPWLSRAAWGAITRLPHGRLRHMLVSDFWRRGYEAWAEGGMEAIVHMLDPQIEWDLSHWADWPEDVYHGHDGFRRFWSDYLSVWEEVEFILDDVIEARDQIVVFLRQSALGKESGVQVDSPDYAQIATMRDGRIARLAFYSNRDEALAAVGLTAEALSPRESPAADMRDIVVTRVERARPPRRERDFVERLQVRFPAAYRRLAARVFPRLSPRSRVRQALLRRMTISAWDAYYRRDFELILVRFSPDVEYKFNPGLQTLGLGGVFHGHKGMLEAFGDLTEVWESWELDPACVVDLGERALFFGFNRSRARTSGVTLEHEYAQLVTLGTGVITHFQNFFSWEEALRAAGLDPAGIALPVRGKASQEASSAA